MRLYLLIYQEIRFNFLEKKITTYYNNYYIKDMKKKCFNEMIRTLRKSLIN